MIYRGSDELARVYRGTTIVWEPGSGDSFETQYLTLEAAGMPSPIDGEMIYGGDLYWKHEVFNSYSAETGYTIEVSKDSGSTWAEYVSTASSRGTLIGTMQQGDKWLFRGWNRSYRRTHEEWFAGEVTDSHAFLSGYAVFNAYGNMGSMKDGWQVLNPDYSSLNTGPGDFYGFFSGTYIISAENLVLPQPRDSSAPSKRYSGCRQGMFANCVYLKYPPKVLTATDVQKSGYESMFSNCHSLVRFPNILATSVSERGMAFMFRGCDSVQGPAPVLRGEPSFSRAYMGMFLGCSGITEAPLVQVRVSDGYVPDEAFSNMFEGCTNLSYVKCLARRFGNIDPTYYWLSDVSPTGTFVKHPDMEDWETGPSGIPSGWTIVDAT